MESYAPQNEKSGSSPDFFCFAEHRSEAFGLSAFIPLHPMGTGERIPPPRCASPLLSASSVPGSSNLPTGVHKIGLWYNKSGHLPLESPHFGEKQREVSNFLA